MVPKNTTFPNKYEKQQLIINYSFFFCPPYFDTFSNEEVSKFCGSPRFSRLVCMYCLIFMTYLHLLSCIYSGIFRYMCGRNGLEGPPILSICPPRMLRFMMGYLGFRRKQKLLLYVAAALSALVSRRRIFFHGNLGVMLRDVKPFLFFLIFRTRRVQSYLYTWYFQILKILKEFPAVFRMNLFLHMKVGVKRFPHQDPQSWGIPMGVSARIAKLPNLGRSNNAMVNLIMANQPTPPPNVLPSEIGV